MHRLEGYVMTCLSLYNQPIILNITIYIKYRASGNKDDKETSIDGGTTIRDRS